MSEAAPTETTSPRGFWRHVAQSLRGEHHDYTAGSLGTAILLLAVPMVLEMALESLFALVDIWWVNRIDDGWFGIAPTHGAAAASVGVTEGVLSIVYALAFGVGMAVTALVARRVGERDLAAAGRTAGQAIGLALVLGVGLGAPALWFAPELLGLMSGDNASVVAAGTGYARWLLGGSAIITLLFLQNAIFRGAGDPILALRVLAVANGINLVLDPCLIFGLGPFPQLGVTGAAVATCTGRTVAVVYQFWLLRRGRCRVPVDRLVRFEPRALWQLVRLSAGTVGQFLIGTSSWLVLMHFGNRFGEAAGAGYTTGIRILLFALLPAWGLSNAAATLVGQNLGAGRPQRAAAAVWATGLYNMLFLGAVTLVMELWPEAIAGLFVSDAVVLGHAVATLRIVAAGYICYAWGMVFLQAFNGAGDTRTPTWLHVWFFWLLELPLAWLLAFALAWGPAGVFASIPIAETCFALAALVLFRRGRWQNVKV